MRRWLTVRCKKLLLFYSYLIMESLAALCTWAGKGEDTLKFFLWRTVSF